MKSGTLLATWVFLALSAVAALGQVRGEAADAVLAADVVRRQGQVFDDVEKTGGRFLEESDLFLAIAASRTPPWLLLGWGRERI